MHMPVRLIVLFSLVLLAACTSASPPRQEGRARYLLGVSALSEGNPTMALQEFLAAEKLKPEDAEVQAGLGQAYMQKRAYPLAERHFLRAVELSGGEAQNYNNLGALYLTMERYDEAVAAFRHAAEDLLFATPEIALTGMGVASFRLRDYTAAERSFRSALEHNPRYAQAYLRLGELYAGTDRPAEAIAAYNRSLELNPRLVDAHFQLAVQLLRGNDHAQARREFEEVLKLAPDSEQARQARSYLKYLP